MTRLQGLFKFQSTRTALDKAEPESEEKREPAWGWITVVVLSVIAWCAFGYWIWKQFNPGV